MQYTANTKFLECTQASFTRCDLLKTNLANFGPRLQVLKLSQTHSVDSALVLWLCKS